VDLFLQGLFPCRARGFITFAEPTSASSGRWVSAWLQEEPLSLYAEQEGGQEFPCLFVRPSRILFVWKDGWSMPGYPRRASNDAFGELLTGKSKWRPVPHSIGAS